MPEIHTRMLELAKEALSEQERQVAEVRSRAVAVLSVGTFVTGFLGKAALAGPHPVGAGEWLGAVLAVVGCLLLGRSVLVLLGARRIAFSLDPRRVYRWLHLGGAINQPGLDFELANKLMALRDRNAAALALLGRALDLSIFGVVLLSSGLAISTALRS